MRVKFTKIILSTILIWASTNSFAQTIYYQNNGPITVNAFDTTQYFTLSNSSGPVTSGANTYIYIKLSPSSSFSSSPNVWTYTNIPSTSNISTNNIGQFLLLGDGRGGFRTHQDGTIGTTRYFRVWPLSTAVTFDCILVSDTQGLSCAPSATQTLSSLVSNASVLRNVLNMQSAKTAQGLTYDCTVFDVNNICISFAGTRSTGDNGIDATTGALIIAHRPTVNIRFGGYVDQNIGTSESNGLKVKRGSPGYGVFSVWSERTDGLGAEVRASANSGQVDIETTRQVIGTAEAGFGQSNIKSNGVQLEVSYGFAASNNITARPYLGYRRMSHKRAAYTEQSSDAVSFPLQYTGLKQSTDSILVGVRFIGKLTPQTSATIATGFEHNVKNTIDDYQAINADIGSISTIGMKDSWMSKTRPTASLGLVHNIDKKQTVGLSVTHRKEVLQTGSITMGMVQYSVGF